MKTVFTSFALAAAVAGVLSVPATYASDFYRSNYTSEARVLTSLPIIETAYEEREVCRYEYATVRSRNRSHQDGMGDKVVGGLLGAAAGSAVGKGSGKDAAAAIGAVVGSEIAAQDGQLTEGELIGGIAGALIGNQVGKGGGKTAATAAGALIGSIAGENIQNGGAQANSHSSTARRERVQVCEVQEFPKKIIVGYDVTFEYDGYQFSQVLRRDPGAYVQINVNVEALEDGTSLR